MYTVHPVFPIASSWPVGRPHNARKISPDKLSNHEFELLKKKENSELLRGVLEKPDDTKKRVGEAP